MKVGSTEEGAAAAATHTGSLAGNDTVYDTVFAECGAFRPQSIEEMLDIAYICSIAPLPPSDGVGILSVSGGLGVLISDAAADVGLELPAFTPQTQAALRSVLPPQAGLPLLTLERLTFRFAGAGFVLLSATLAAGLLFGETFYGAGRAWRWDHKTVFSVLAWFVFAALLLGRARFGWRGRKAVRVLYAGSLLLLLAYVGSRFVLEVVLGKAA